MQIAFNPTDEQHAILAACRDSPVVKVKAGAGCGKTSVVQLVAADQPRRRMLYVCFTKPVQVHAERVMPANVMSRTLNSLAFEALRIGQRFGSRVGRPLLLKRIQQQLDLDDIAQAVQVRETLKKYCQSADRWIGGHHVPKEAFAGLSKDRHSAVKDALVDASRRFWTKLWDAREVRHGLPHDVYLKQWQAQEGAPLPRKFDLIAADEVQDFNPVQTDSLLRQDCASLWVGDRCQPEDTLVETTDDLMRIEQLRIGDRMISMDAMTETLTEQELTGISQRRYVGPLVRVRLDSGEVSRYTPDHYCPIRVHDGPVEHHPASRLHLFKDGLRLYCRRRGWRYATVDHVHYDGVVWSLQVEHDHCYIADGILTHNCQQIFRWRGAEDAHEKVPGGTTLHLTRSYRFGQAVAQLSNQLLSLKSDPPPPLVGAGGPTRIVTELKHPYVWLFRTNFALLMEAAQLLREGKRVHVVGGLTEAINLLEGAWLLYQGHKQRVVHPMLQLLGHWTALVEASENQPELKAVVSHVRKLGYTIPELVSLVRESGDAPESCADVILSTAFKFKGREHDRVRVHSDFDALIHYDAEGHYRVNEDAVHLAYVAATRARHELWPNAATQEIDDLLALTKG